MATKFLHSLSSIMYAGQIFGIMPALHRRHHSRGRDQPRMQNNSMAAESVVADVSDGDVTYVEEKNHSVSVLGPHDVRIFPEDDANRIVNITTGASVRDYVKSDKSSNRSEAQISRSLHSGGSDQTSGGGSRAYYVPEFSWKYPGPVYSTLLIALGSCEWMCTVFDIVQNGISLGTIGSFNFYTITNFGMIMFFNLAQKWPRLFHFWSEAARVFDQLPYRGTGINPGVRIKRVFCCWSLVALMDTMLFRWVSVNELRQLKETCKLDGDFLELLYKSWRSHIFRIIDFQYWYLPFLELVNVSYTFAWTYVDVFIMMISIGLQSHFELLNERLVKTQGKRMPYTFWIELRTHYVILRNLVDYVGDHIAILIMLSFASNLYFICLQLFNSFVSHYKSWVHMIYFCNTLVLVIVRTLCVLKYSSEIAVSAKKPLSVLKRIPTELWNDELQRFFDMVSHDVVALSGAGFFTMTKSLVLAMVGTVATYELVIVDIHADVNQGEPSLEIICPVE